MTQNIDNLLMQIQDDASGGNLHAIASKNDERLFPFNGRLIGAREAQALLAQQQMRQQQQKEAAAQEAIEAKGADPLQDAPLWMKQERYDRDREADLAKQSIENEAWRAQNINTSIPTEKGTISNWKGPQNNEFQKQAATPEGITVGRSDKELYFEQMQKDAFQHDIDVARAKNTKNAPQQSKPSDIAKAFSELVGTGMEPADAWANIDKAFRVGTGEQDDVTADPLMQAAVQLNGGKPLSDTQVAAFEAKRNDPTFQKMLLGN